MHRSGEFVKCHLSPHPATLPLGLARKPMNDPNPVPINNLGVFLKSPEAGSVKTRLGASIGMQAAAHVYRSFCADLFETLLALDEIRVWVFFEPSDAEESCHEIFEDVGSIPEDWRWIAQSDGDLGARMLAAFTRMLASGGPAVLIGTDLPTLPKERLDAAFVALKSTPAVFGPALDGGYYLLGLSAAVPMVARSRLFCEIAWSTSEVLSASLTRLRESGLDFQLLPRERDIDTLEDLIALAERLSEADSALWQRSRRACAEVLDR